VHEGLLKAVELFNNGRFAEFQDALDAMTSSTRASSERQFYTLLKNVAEALLQLSDGDVEDAEGMVHSALRKLDEFMPRFRGLNVAALREDMQRLLGELRESRAGRRAEIAPSRLPRLRVLPE
jgi:ATP/maltotriose-dependent transcriptional regulator MalT